MIKPIEIHGSRSGKASSDQVDSRFPDYRVSLLNRDCMRLDCPILGEESVDQVMAGSVRARMPHPAAVELDDPAGTRQASVSATQEDAIDVSTTATGSAAWAPAGSKGLRPGLEVAGVPRAPDRLQRDHLGRRRVPGRFGRRSWWRTATTWLARTRSRSRSPAAAIQTIALKSSAAGSMTRTVVDRRDHASRLCPRRDAPQVVIDGSGVGPGRRWPLADSAASAGASSVAVGIVNFSSPARPAAAAGAIQVNDGGKDLFEGNYLGVSSERRRSPSAPNNDGIEIDTPGNDGRRRRRPRR